MDASFEVELGFLGDQQDAPATRAFGAAKILGQSLLGAAGELDAHRRTSSTLPHRTPIWPDTA
jgi:hypothetical protein